MYSSTKSETKYFFLFTSIAIIGFLLFYAYPVLRTLYLSMTDMKIGTPHIDFVGLDNYLKAVTKDELFMHSIKLSFIYAFTTGPLTLIISLIAAMLLNLKVEGIGVFRTIFFLPFIVPTFAVASVFKGFFHPSSGVINQVLASIGILGPGWYMDSSTALLTLVIISCWGFGIKMLIFLAALQNVPVSFYEVADLDGAGLWKKFRNVTFPMISPVFFFNVVLTTIDCLKSFNLVFFMGTRGDVTGFPANSTLLFPIYLYNTAFKLPYKLGYASTLAWILFIIILALTGLNFLLSKLYVNEAVE